MRRTLLTLAFLLATAACGFGFSNDTGKPIPEGWWPWVCPDGTVPAPDAGCPAVDGGAADAGP
jgi:hypothetical protein